MAQFCNGLPQPLNVSGMSVIGYLDNGGDRGERALTFAAFLAAFDLDSRRLLAGSYFSTALGVRLHVWRISENRWR